MKGTARILVTVILSGLVAALLSYLPQFEQGRSQGKLALSVFKKTGAQQLNQQNIVDIMIELPLQLRIRKVELSRGILSIDLNISSSTESGTVYKDLYQIAFFALKDTSNVTQVLVRGLDASHAAVNPTGQLLIAMDARREDIPAGQAAVKADNAALLRQFVQNHFRVTTTSRWNERYNGE